MIRTSHLIRRTSFLVVLLLTVVTLTASAQKPNRPKFDPAKFEADLEQFITTEAALSPQEAAAFFPLYREMQRKQRVFFDEMKRFRHLDTNDDKACEEAIEKRDKMDIGIKELQQDYHRKFIKVLPAGKVFKIMRAEDKFHRQAFRRAANPAK